MPRTVDKVVVANRSGMDTKYGTPGLVVIDAALQRLIVADATRGLTTSIVNIDDAKQMASVGGAAIVNGSDQAGAKRAVDAIYTKLNPDYILLLDGPDVIPHIALSRIPGLPDNDKTIDSDLPYASLGGFSQKASNYLAITRVVGRLPMTQGSSDAAAFATLIDRCANFTPTTPDHYSSYFAISAGVWQQSTQLSLSALFGNHADLKLSPAGTHPAIDTYQNRLTHFINCHGGQGDPSFYGQLAQSYPVSMDSLRTSPNVRSGAVVAAECCYGAELYNNNLLGNAQPICMSYLLNGAIAFMGSTTIAYGPAASNGQADLISQYFLERVLQGASIGRAMLEARQKFVSSQSMSGPSNLKTLVQFVLYGDPSVHAVVPPKTASDGLASVDTSAETTAKDLESSRKSKRAQLKSDGRALAEAASYSSRRTKGSATAIERVRTIAKSKGFSGEPEVFSVTGGVQFLNVTKEMKRKPQVVVVSQKRDNHHDIETGKKLPSFHVLVAYILGDGITAIEESESR
ncbi:C25 family cysteine peptidase [Mesorhizobium sp. M1227]|uniref:C25 family cysteine peptidase n=1 Tax=Mesorhizobium sp. M1227 TaxID=2957071 RepID=UPI0033357DCB